METEKISVDDLFARQRKLGSGIRATIKPESDDRVTVTPFIAAGSCGCSLKITVKKSDIQSVAPTDDVSACCGERLMVVEVAFANETVAGIFRQLGEAAMRSATARSLRAFQHRPRAYSPALPREAPTNYELCVESCHLFAHSDWDFQQCMHRCAVWHPH